MKSRYTALVIAGALFLAACGDTPESTAPALSRSGNAASTSTGDTYLVKFKGNKVPADFGSSVSAMGGSVLFAHSGVGLAAVSGLSEASASQISSRSDVSAVEMDLYTTVGMPGELTTAAADVSSAAAPATAFFFPRQWHMRAIGADLAWAAGKLGSSSVKVGIIDTGLGYTHADLAGRVDLANSVSFVPSDDALVQAFFPGAHPIADLHYHGTHVGATVSSNALAGAGVTSATTLVGIKVCNVNGQCPTSGVLGGILYAADLGLPIVNMSLGGFFNRRDGSAAGGLPPSFIAIINSAFNYANQKGTVVVVSAGNDAIDMDHNGNEYVAYCNAPHVVCVSALGPTAAGGVNGPFVDVDALAGYSNFGRSGVTVAGPGGTNAAPVWEACSPFSLQIPVCQTGTFILGLGGTSMASPHVTGVGALLLADGVNGASSLRARIQASTDDLGSAGTDPVYGRGRISAAKAVGAN